MARYYSEQTLLDMRREGMYAGYDLYDLEEFLTCVPTADVAPKSEVASEICSLLEDYLSHMTETTSKELKKAQEECIVGSIIACNSYQLILNSMNLLVKGIKNKYVEGGDER